ncbi:MAG: hypothetical protein ACMG51_10245, partial [Ginsengibacter sp.]
QLTFRPISHFMGGRREWYNHPTEMWHTGLQHADKLLGDALEEAEVQGPTTESQPRSREHGGSIAVTVNNQNVFAPAVHVSVTQILERLDGLSLSPTEKDLAVQHVRELQAETQGEKRWPIIARAIEGMKALGKSVYREVAIPLLVEFLKSESGLHSP